MSRDFAHLSRASEVETTHRPLGALSFFITSMYELSESSNPICLGAIQDRGTEIFCS